MSGCFTAVRPTVIPRLPKTSVITIFETETFPL
jgi:hypothetical protein